MGLTYRDQVTFLITRSGEAPSKGAAALLT